MKQDEIDRGPAPRTLPYPIPCFASTVVGWAKLRKSVNREAEGDGDGSRGAVGLQHKRETCILWDQLLW